MQSCSFYFIGSKQSKNKEKNRTPFIITEMQTLLKTNTSLLFQKTNQHSSQHEPEEVAVQYNYVTAIYLFYVHPHVDV